MKKIYKFPLEIEDRQLVHIPEDARLLTVQMQGPNKPMLWAIVCTDNDVRNEDRWIRCFGTGHPFDADPNKYLGTVQLHGGSLIFHYFDGGPA